eukprot:13567959-Alexandrium_andersonii.AAC.1
MVRKDADTGKLSTTFAHPLEYGQAMGFNLLSDHAPKSDLLPIFEAMSPCKLKKMFGNGMQLSIEA